MNHYQRNYREYLRGIIAGLNSLFSTEGKYFEIEFFSLSKKLDLKKSIQNKLTEHHWEKGDIPEVQLVNKELLRGYLAGIFRQGINLRIDNLIKEIIYTLDSEFGICYDLYHSLHRDEEGEVLVILLETNSERLLITLSYELSE